MIENGDNQFRMKILKAKNEKVSSLKNNLNGKIVIDNGELLIYNRTWSSQLFYHSIGK